MVDQISKKIDISIILVNYNSYSLTEQTLSSFLKFTYGFSYEIIIVDNASADNSGKRLKDNYPEYVYILNDKNLGFAKANNLALNVAKGDYILFLNNDVIFIENTINELLNYLKKSNDKILIAPRLLNKDGTIQYSVYSFQTLWLSFTTYFFLYALFPKSKYFNRYYLMNRGVDKIIEVDGVTGAFMLFRKKDIIELNGFDENFFFYGEDNDLCKRFRDSGGKIIYYPKVSLIHLKGGTNKTNWFHEKNHLFSARRLFKKHFPKHQRVIAIILLYFGNLSRGIILFIKYLFTKDILDKNESKLKFGTLKLLINDKT